MRSLLVAASVAALPACVPAVQPIEDGHYTLTALHGDDTLTAADEGTTLDVDRDASTVVLSTADDGDVTIALSFRPRSAWLVGCPTNTSHTALEIADLDVDSLAFGDVTVDDPVLVADCFSGAVVVRRSPTDTAGPCGDGECAVFESDVAE